MNLQTKFKKKIHFTILSLVFIQTSKLDILIDSWSESRALPTRTFYLTLIRVAHESPPLPLHVERF